jgi:hypothetical protein
MPYALIKKVSRGGMIVVRIEHPELTQEIMLMEGRDDPPSAFQVRAFAIRTGQAPIGGPIEWDPLGELDREDPGTVLKNCLRAHGLDPDNCTWAEILARAILAAG